MAASAGVPASSVIIFSAASSGSNFLVVLQVNFTTHLLSRRYRQQLASVKRHELLICQCKDICQVRLQVQFPPSIYSTAADNYKSLLTSSIAAAFMSDASFYYSYGPATAAASSYAEGFAFVGPPPPPGATALPPPPPPFTQPPPGSVHPPPPPTAAVASSPPPPVFMLALQCVWRSSRCGVVMGLIS